jgi:hypothetical protein
MASGSAVATSASYQAVQRTLAETERGVHLAGAMLQLFGAILKDPLNERLREVSSQQPAVRDEAGVKDLLLLAGFVATSPELLVLKPSPDGKSDLTLLRRAEYEASQVVARPRVSRRQKVSPSSGEVAQRCRPVSGEHVRFGATQQARVGSGASGNNENARRRGTAAGPGGVVRSSAPPPLRSLPVNISALRAGDTDDRQAELQKKSR